MTGSITGKPVAEMAFEEAMQALEGVVTQLERGEVKLEESIALYERGAALKARCDVLLREAEEKVEKIRLAEGRVVGAEAVTGL
jgi:exodeoxyribonuclease VII small subunit